MKYLLSLVVLLLVSCDPKIEDGYVINKKIYHRGSIHQVGAVMYNYYGDSIQCDITYGKFVKGEFITETKGVNDITCSILNENDYFYSEN